MKVASVRSKEEIRRNISIGITDTPKVPNA